MTASDEEQASRVTPPSLLLLAQSGGELEGVEPLVACTEGGSSGRPFDLVARAAAVRETRAGDDR